MSDSLRSSQVGYGTEERSQVVAPVDGEGFIITPQNLLEHFIVTPSADSPVSISLRPLGESEKEKEAGVPHGISYMVREVADDQNGYAVRPPGVSFNTDRRPTLDNYGSSEPEREKGPYPENPMIANYRAPLPLESRGFMHISARENQNWKKSLLYRGGETEKDEEDQEISDTIRGASHAAALPEYVTEELFEKIYNDFKGENGKFLALTAYGAVPLPEEMLQSIPAKFTTEPLIEEREVFVLKQEHLTRLANKEYTKFKHKFRDVSKVLVIDKIKTIDEVQVVEIPYFKYKPVVEEKLVEIPCGIKYVEVPLEVPCKMPPRIIPVPKERIIERLVEASKPVVQEKIVEVYEVVRKQVPKVVIKEIPYVVPRYVEKIIEVPYQLGQELPEPRGYEMTTIPAPPPLPIIAPPQLLNHCNVTREQKGGEAVPEINTVPYITFKEEGAFSYSDAKKPHSETFYMNKNVKHIQLPYEAEIDVSVVEDKDIPPEVPLEETDPRYMSCGHQCLAYGSPDDNLEAIIKGGGIRAGSMEPVIKHSAPQMRAIEFRTRGRRQPEILTQRGIMESSSFQEHLKEDALDRLVLPLGPP